MDEQRASVRVVVTNPQGLHARPADMIVKLAKQFKSRIELVKGHQRADGKSILEILTLAAVAGTELAIEAAGPDAQTALAAVAELVGSDFPEPETT